LWDRIHIGYNSGYLPMYIVREGFAPILARSGWGEEESFALSLALQLLTYHRFEDLLAEYYGSIEVDPRDISARDLALYLWSCCVEEGPTCITKVLTLAELLTARDVIAEGRLVSGTWSRVVATNLLARVGTINSSEAVPDPTTEYVAAELGSIVEAYAGYSLGRSDIVAAALLLHRKLRTWANDEVIDMALALAPVLAAPSREVHVAIARAFVGQGI